MQNDRTQLQKTAAKTLAAGGLLQSSQGQGEISDDVLLVATEKAIGRHLDQLSEPGSADAAVARVGAIEVVTNARKALAKESSTWTDLEYSSLEAIVHVTGRPALNFLDGDIEMPDEVGENNFWAVLIATERKKINTVAKSVGRVLLTGAGSETLLGTGWRVSGSLLVTNRHVLRYLVSCPSEPFSRWSLASPCKATINFTARNREPQKFSVKRIVYCAAEDEIDAAILELDSVSSLPPPLSIDWSMETLGATVDAGGDGKEFKGEAVYTIGHPYYKAASRAVAAVFGKADGRKRCSPGYVTGLSSNHPTLEHDCSTLGGNSGSCVVSVRNHAVIGLHFGGVGVNFASAEGRANVALAFARLADNAIGRVLRPQT